jgi:DNA-directed RNA polymerase specialized sigma24 family protein
VVEESYLNGLTQQEIADKLGLKLGSIGVYLDRGLKALKQNLPPGWP